MRNQWLLNFAVFIGFLVLGYNFSTRIFRSNGTSVPPFGIQTVSDRGYSVTSLDNGQQSILIISISSVRAADPNLENIWLASYLPSAGELRLFPIYPGRNQVNSNFEKELGQTFKLVNQAGVLTLGNSFVETLENENYWWSGFILLDDESTAKILDLLEENGLISRLTPGSNPLDESSPAIANQDGTHSTRLALIKSVCENVSTLVSTTKGSQILSGLIGYTITDLNVLQLQQEIESVFSAGHLSTCSNPTLELLGMNR